MTMPSVIVKDYLLSRGYNFAVPSTTDGWNIWIGKQPTDPHRTITIYDVPGEAPNPRWLLDFPAVQIRVRGKPSDYNEAGKEAQKLKNLLIGVPSFDALDGLGDRVVLIKGIGDVGFVGWDGSARPEFVLNLSMIIEPADSADTQREPL